MQRTVNKTLNQEIASMDDRGNWEMRVLVSGGILGAIVGLVTSWLLIRTSREVRGGPPAISTGDAIKVGVTAIGLVRSIASLGDKP